MICQYTHLGIGKSLTIQVSNMVCIHCGIKVPPAKLFASYRGHKSFTPTKYRVASAEQEIMTDWFSISPEFTCECGKCINEIYWPCQGDWWKSFLPIIEKMFPLETITTSASQMQNNPDQKD